MHITQELFDSVFHDPHAHVTNIDDIGVVRVDLVGDQPPYVGLILSLEHREIPGITFKQFFKLPDPLIEQLAASLSDMQHFIRSESAPPAPKSPPLF